MNATKVLVAAIFATALAAPACSPSRTMAMWTASAKSPAPPVEAAKGANQQFWEVLHGGRYEAIPETLDRLTAVYLDNPNDAETAAHIGFLHIWRIAESARQPNLAPSITDHVVLAHKYFGEAVQLAPSDVRFQGFLASLELMEGNIHKDEKLTRRGYFDLMDAKDAWPEFNLFTAGYVMSGLPHTESRYADAVEYQWETLDRCANEKVDRKTGAFGKYMALETKEGPKRACWNSWIAPHNFEGFFLNMGDMIVKQGDVATARQVYAQAKHSKTYASWPYREVLEKRIEEAETNVPRFRKPPRTEKERPMMGDSAFTCMACHQG
ncbi:MAG: hypothetical protein JST00_31975 [Deltaproteobacteria bacterium]|nr:hypothetical protein [Deltaproteobacteria bacterium]